jgi:hypothetical protein
MEFGFHRRLPTAVTIEQLAVARHIIGLYSSKNYIEPRLLIDTLGLL